MVFTLYNDVAVSKMAKGNSPWYELKPSFKTVGKQSHGMSGTGLTTEQCRLLDSSMQSAPFRCLTSLYTYSQGVSFASCKNVYLIHG